MSSKPERAPSEWVSAGRAPVALVTGASSGIGEAAARELARRGHSVAMVARRAERLEQVAKEIESAGGRAIALAADLADADATREVVRKTTEHLGPVDVLVNNAGYSPGAAVEQWDRDALRHIFEVNLLSGLDLCAAVLPSMRERGRGRIVNVGSMGGAVPAPLAAPYGATKAGMEAATRSLRLEVARFGIEAVLVIPGFVDTAVFENAREGSQHLRDDAANPYRDVFFALDAFTKKQLGGALRPIDVAQVIADAATATKPKARYYAPASARFQSGFLGLLPERWLDWILARTYRIPLR